MLYHPQNFWKYVGYSHRNVQKETLSSGLFRPKDIEWIQIFVTFIAACKVMMTGDSVMCGSMALLREDFSE